MTTSTNTNSFEIHLPKEVRSLNKTLKDHWSVRTKDKKDWRVWIAVKLQRCGELKGQPFFLSDSWFNRKKYITITRILGPRQRPFDHDNLVGGCKGLVDAMKGIIIKDDTAEYVEVKYLQKKGERGGTIIKVSFGKGR